MEKTWENEHMKKIFHESHHSSTSPSCLDLNSDLSFPQILHTSSCDEDSGK